MIFISLECHPSPPSFVAFVFFVVVIFVVIILIIVLILVLIIIRQKVSLLYSTKYMGECNLVVQIGLNRSKQVQTGPNRS